MVTINGVEFGGEYYDNGETLFRTVDLDSRKVVDIEVGIFTLADLFQAIIAVEYVKDNNKEYELRVRPIKRVRMIPRDLLEKFFDRMEVKAIGLEKFPEHPREEDDDRLYRQNTIYYTSDNSIMGVLLEYESKPFKDLNMHCIPYGRMDRVVANKIFTFKYFASMINKYNFENVFACDIHNDTSKLINNLVEIRIKPVIDKVRADFNPDVICFPDGGAYEKYPLELGYKDIPYVYGRKRRDALNSQDIILYELCTNGVDLKGRRVLIIDDICSTGSTVVKAANKLRENGASSIAMYVTHYENTRQSIELAALESFEKIYTTDSIPRFVKLGNLDIIKVVNQK